MQNCLTTCLGLIKTMMQAAVEDSPEDQVFDIQYALPFAQGVASIAIEKEDCGKGLTGEDLTIAGMMHSSLLQRDMK